MSSFDCCDQKVDIVIDLCDREVIEEVSVVTDGQDVYGEVIIIHSLSMIIHEMNLLRCSEILLKVNLPSIELGFFPLIHLFVCLSLLR